MSSLNRLPVFWVAAVLLVGSQARLTAQEPVKIRVVVVAILATEANNHIDPKLHRIAQEVQKIDPKLTGFRFGSATSKRLSVSTKETFPLIDDEHVDVFIEHGPDKDKRVGLRVQPTGVGEITYKTACGKCFPIVTRYQTKDKERLIVAVLVRPCHAERPKQ